jgi:glycosyltransferase involved in cell wall biosynthesis
VDGVIAVTGRDVQIIRQAAPEARIELLPNGVDCAYFSPRAAAEGLRLVFVGTLDYPPNQQAIQNFWEAVWPRLRPRQVPWVIAGSGLPKALEFVHRDPLIQFHQNAPDVRQFLDAQAILVAPILVGGGSRLKILTALAMGCPVVTTSIGCEGLDVQDGVQVLIADDPETMLGQVERLLDDAALRQKLGRAGRQLVLEKYDWAQVLAPLERIYAGLARQGEPPLSGR